MPGIELTKSEKKAAREIVEMGLQKEFAKALLDVGIILDDWKSKGSDNRDAYYRLLRKLRTLISTLRGGMMECLDLTAC